MKHCVALGKHLRNIVSAERVETESERECGKKQTENSIHKTHQIDRGALATERNAQNDRDEKAKEKERKREKRTLTLKPSDKVILEGEIKHEVHSSLCSSLFHPTEEEEEEKSEKIH